jgi:hypothetical protein
MDGKKAKAPSNSHPQRMIPSSGIKDLSSGTVVHSKLPECTVADSGSNTLRPTHHARVLSSSNNEMNKVES